MSSGLYKGKNKTKTSSLPTVKQDSSKWSFWLLLSHICFPFSYLVSRGPQTSFDVILIPSDQSEEQILFLNSIRDIPDHLPGSSWSQKLQNFFYSLLTQVTYIFLQKVKGKPDSVFATVSDHKKTYTFQQNWQNHSNQR